MTSKKRIFKRLSIRILVANMFLLAIVITASVAISLQYSASKRMAVSHMLSSMNLLSDHMSDSVYSLENDAKQTVSLLAELINSDLSDASIERKSSLFAQFLKKRPELYSLYIGDKQEHFFQLINLDSAKDIRQRMGAQPDDRWAVVEVSGSNERRLRQTYFYTSTFHLNHQQTENSNFYPTERPWFAASAQNDIYKTPPYLFQHLQISGQTYAQRIRNTDQVIGLDILLSSLSDQLSLSSSKLINGQEQAFLFSQNGEIIASNINSTHSVITPEIQPILLSQQQKEAITNLGRLKVSNQNDWRPFDFSESGVPKGYFIELMQMISAMTGLKFDYINGFSREQLVQKYKDDGIDILLSVQKAQNTDIEGLYSVPLRDIPYAIVTKNITQEPKSLSDLNGKTVGFLGRWSVLPMLKTHFPNIKWQESITERDLISRLQSGQYDAIIGASPVLKSTISIMEAEGLQVYDELVEINNIVPSHFYLVTKEKQKFALDLINQALSQITPAQRDALDVAWLQQNTQYMQDHLDIPFKKLIKTADDPNAKQPLIIKKNDGTRYYIFIKNIGNDIFTKQYFTAVITEKMLFQQATKEAFHSALLSALVMVILLPIIWLFSTPIVRPIRQLQRVTEKIKLRQFDDVAFVDSNIKEIWQLSNSFVSMSQDIKQHEASQKGFMEALIRLIATAIDDKSAHTGGHCYRVPELGLMLSDALEKAEEGPYKAFKFANDNERLEFRIAAWLHDCGKITMPEHIIDKGSKLECTYNRIHEIRTRFEVLWRDAEIDYLHKVHIEKQDPTIALTVWEERQTILQEEFAIVAKANVGSELMSEKDRQKIKEIGAQEWIRHFSNRLGLSPAEEMMLAKQAQAGNLESEQLGQQAVIETLLSDKLEHIIPRLKNINYPPSLGIKMTIPKHQYNQGEIYNLTIKKGTLTKEDRFKINEHIISTITMLESLPFPPELSRVPHYASTHHERMDGQGYPRKLNAEQLSLPDRVLMIADVFEALTASDRPYKKAKPISVAIDIMFNMCQEGHLDLQLFRFFLESDTYLKYAEKFLPKDQIDTVNIKPYLENLPKKRT
ncbi:HD domain-containing phosphohydrolase [Marinomonas sp. BSi20584]|uniref:HD domain-containing phosphohydrolase n=1 Tax=Marinomonas sp. BSi20584 TaxID=1594462 RepID=UPI0018E107C2|nr:HD domain-containing phosphohydrolase [Marinomonas sp. BSi20584]